MQCHHLFKILKEIMVEWEMLKIPRKELSEIMNSVNSLLTLKILLKTKTYFVKITLLRYFFINFESVLVKMSNF